jgi:dienelactone hydrolase
MLRTLMAALAAAALAGCASPSGSLGGSAPGDPHRSVKVTTGEPVSFANATPGHPLRVPGTIYRPSGTGPFPAMVLLHGCHGVSASTRDWGTWFRELGFVALVVDSWAPRAFPADCGPSAPELPSTERFDDAMGGLAFLQSLPYVARGRVGVIGWSNGGVFAMSVVNGPSLDRARARGVTLPEPGFQAAVGVSPGGCFSLVQERVIRPLLVLIGDADDWTLASVCGEMVAAMKSRGAVTSIVSYPGAFHYFDVEGQPRTFLSEVANRNMPNECCGATVGYDPAAFADSRRRVADFFRRHLHAEGGREAISPRLASR